ncbi:MAG: hypothetical protein ABT08_12415 [Microbacterium sp. SCN 71-21]|nr:MAG: hypothetical protein ABS80_01805 [Pseudonocardia sp. SCN 72-51]ODU72784.1 MAG: hypothetical protein ABT08_12415 [Microbacterium sp. SCN 71-21]
MVRGHGGPSLWVIVAIAVLVLFAGGLGYGIYRAQNPTVGDAAAPADGDTTGITVGRPTAKATIEIYLDFQCPACKAYEAQIGPQIEQFVASGQAKVIYRPVAFLNRFSSTQYSTRSSQASACAANDGVFPQYLKLLYENQPPENAAGLPEERLISLGEQAGAGSSFAACVRDDRYAGWTASVTDAASKAGITSTPTVKVNGTEVVRSAAALTAAVRQTQR